MNSEFLLPTKRDVSDHDSGSDDDADMMMPPAKQPRLLASSPSPTPDPETSSEPVQGSSTAKSDPAHPFRNLFQKELRQMMYGSGDVSNPLPESLDLLEDMTVDFITQMTRKAARIAGSRDRVRKDDLLFAIRDQPRMFARANELLRMNRIVSEATKKIDNTDIKKLR